MGGRGATIGRPAYRDRRGPMAGRTSTGCPGHDIIFLRKRFFGFLLGVRVFHGPSHGPLGHGTQGPASRSSHPPSWVMCYACGLPSRPTRPGQPPVWRLPHGPGYQPSALGLRRGPGYQPPTWPPGTGISTVSAGIAPRSRIQATDVGSPPGTSTAGAGTAEVEMSADREAATPPYPLRACAGALPCCDPAGPAACRP